MSEQVKLLSQSELPDRSGLTELEILNHRIRVYHPFDRRVDRRSDIINYAFTAPTFVVFPDQSLSPEESVRLAEDLRLIPVAAENGSSIIFINPVEDWTRDDANEGIYEALLSSMKLGLMDFKQGIFQDVYHPVIFARLPEHVRKTRPIPKGDYYVHGCGIRAHLIGLGRGADFICRHYLKKISGQGVLGDLGPAEMTVTSCVLSGLSAVPQLKEHTDIIVVSAGNSPECDEALAKHTEHFMAVDSLDLSALFDEKIGNWQRWMGRLSPAHNYRTEGIRVLPRVLSVKTDPDNVDFDMLGAEHPVGFVLFHDEHLDVSPSAARRLPLLLCFHGGGDTAIATAGIGEWPEIAKAHGFLLLAVEYHLQVPASEVMQIVDRICAEYPVDRERLYATGFSMGGIKTWDLFQEYPSAFAALAPMCATVEVGSNCQFISARRVNREIPVPAFWVGGEASPLPELPFQGQKCLDRMEYLLEVNRCRRQCHLSYEDRETWEDPVIGIPGDETVVAAPDPAFPDSVTTLDRFMDTEGHFRTVVAHVSHQMHEIRPNTCRLAWDFLKRFRRLPDGTVAESSGD